MIINRASEFLRREFPNPYLVDTLGFEKHMRQIRERRSEKVPAAWYERPYFYCLRLENEKMKGHGDTLYFPSYVAKKDYEFELVGLFTEPIKTVNLDEAVEYVKNKMFFTIFNDLSCRDFQADDMKLPLGVSASKGISDKSFGPVFVSSRELNFDSNGVPLIGMRLWVNNELRPCQAFDGIYFLDPKTGKPNCWGFAQVIAWFGKMNQGFKAGDLLGSGTVGSGSIAEFARKTDKNGNEIEPAEYPWLKEGDVIKMEAEGIGTLENTVGVIDMRNPKE